MPVLECGNEEEEMGARLDVLDIQFVGSLRIDTRDIYIYIYESWSRSGGYQWAESRLLDAVFFEGQVNVELTNPPCSGQ